MQICNDLTVVIPIKIDSNDRLQNLKVVLNYLKLNFKTNIIIGENSKKSVLSKLEYDYKYTFIEDKNDIFHKTKTLNLLYDMCNTPYIAAWDSDVFVDPKNILKSLSNLRSNRVDFSYPFDNRICDVPRKFVDVLLKNPNISSINEKDCKYRPIDLVTGCLLIFNKDKMIEYGMENEKFIGWGGEDDERYERIIKLGGKLEYLKDCGPVYHIRHFRGSDSRPVEGLLYTPDNREELVKTRNMTKEELLQSIKCNRSDTTTSIIKPKKNKLNKYIIVRQDALTSKGINLLYEKLKNILQDKPFIFSCITNTPDDIDPNIEIISDEFFDERLSTEMKDLYLLSNKYNNTIGECFYIKEQFNSFNKIKENYNTKCNEKIITDGETFFKFQTGIFHNIYESFITDMQKMTDIFEFMNKYKIHWNLEEDSPESIMRRKLNTIGPGFCLAKWEQVTMHLQLGHTHSCHYPTAHPVTLEELKTNPSAIHNSIYKKTQRHSMLNGGMPYECDYCWNIEKSSKENFSERHLKSSHIAPERFNEVIECGSEGNYSPSYVELAFSSLCNFKCSYCSPEFSSSWQNEIAKNGEYTLKDAILYKDNWDEYINKIKAYGSNPYVEAFWKWLPELYPKLKVLRLTGGEPLLDTNFFKVCDYINEHPNNKLELSINTNLNPPKQKYQKFLDSISVMLDKNNVKEILMYVSIDGWNKSHMEYVRDGLNMDMFEENLESLLENYISKYYSKIKISIMCTYTALSIFSFLELLKKVKSIKEKYNQRHSHSIDISTSYIRHPQHMHIDVLPFEMSIPLLDEQLQYMEDNTTLKLDNNQGFYDYEVMKFKRIVDMYKHNKLNLEGIDAEYDTNRNIHQINFYKFFTQYDKRRNKNLIETFPQLEDFYNQCKRKSIASK